MSFIIEFLPTQEDPNKFVYVVRHQNGYPISVCDSLYDCNVVMEKLFNEMRKANSPKS